MKLFSEGWKSTLLRRRVCLSCVESKGARTAPFRCEEDYAALPAGGKVKLGAYNALRRRLKMKQPAAYRF